jgi:hypothetical protein
MFGQNREEIVEQLASRVRDAGKREERGNQQNLQVLLRLISAETRLRGS